MPRSWKYDTDWPAHIPERWESITPDDDADIDDPGSVTGIYASAAGNVRITSYRGTTFTIPVPAMAHLPTSVRRIHSTGTTATGLFVSRVDPSA